MLVTGLLLAASARLEWAAGFGGYRRPRRGARHRAWPPDADHHRKGGKIVTIPLAPRTALAIDLAIGERSDGPLFLAPDGRRLDRHGAARIVRRVAGRAGISKPVGPHRLGRRPLQSSAAGFDTTPI